MSEMDRFGLFEDECHPHTVLMAVYRWRMQQTADPTEVAIDKLRAGRLYLPLLKGFHKTLCECMSGDPDRDDFLARNLDALLFAQDEIWERCMPQRVTLNMPRRSTLRMKHAIAEALRSGLPLEAIPTHLGISRATLYRHLKKKD